MSANIVVEWYILFCTPDEYVAPQVIDERKHRLNTSSILPSGSWL